MKGDEATNYGRVALEFVERVEKLESRQDVLNAIQAAIADFGFEYFAMSDLPQPFRSDVPTLVGMKAPAGWAEHYVARKFHLIDPVVRFCHAARGPATWTEIAQHASRDAQGLEVMARASDFGLAHGLALPTRNLNGRTSCISMSARQAPYVNRFTKPAIHLMALYAFERVRELDWRRGGSDDDLLTSREREVLTWAAAGKSAASTAELLGITQRTVVAHSVNAMQKLGAANKTQAVAIALTKRLIFL